MPRKLKHEVVGLNRSSFSAEVQIQLRLFSVRSMRTFSPHIGVFLIASGFHCSSAFCPIVLSRWADLRQQYRSDTDLSLTISLRVSSGAAAALPPQPKKGRPPLPPWPPAERAALDRFWRTFEREGGGSGGGVTARPRATLVQLGERHSIFRNETVLRARLEALAALGAPHGAPLDVARIAARAPTLLLHVDVAVTVAPKLAALAALFPGTDIPQLVRRRPQLLTLSDAAPRLASLGAALGSEAAARAAAARHPQLLGMSIERTVAPRLAELALLLPHLAPAGVAALVAAQPSLLTSSASGLTGLKVWLMLNYAQAAGQLVELSALRPASLGRVLTAGAGRHGRLEFLQQRAAESLAAGYAPEALRRLPLVSTAVLAAPDAFAAGQPDYRPWLCSRLARISIRASSAGAGAGAGASVGRPRPATLELETTPMVELERVHGEWLRDNW